MNNQILVELQSWMGNDREIAESAWTSSFNKDTREQKTDEQVAELVPRLIKDGHGTQFESVIFRIWIRMPIYTDRQHCTHRIGSHVEDSHNGLSGRYRTMPLDYFDLPEDVEVILAKVERDTIVRPCPNADWNIFESYYESCETAINNYRLGIEQLKQAEKEAVITNAEFKRVREILRGQLPTSGMVERTTIMNLRSFANYQFQRNSLHDQPEIKQVEQLMLEEVKKANVAPIAIKTLEEMGWKL